MKAVRRFKRCRVRPAGGLKHASAGVLKAPSGLMFSDRLFSGGGWRSLGEAPVSFSPRAPKLGFTRVRHCKRPKSDKSDFGQEGGEDRQGRAGRGACRFSENGKVPLTRQSVLRTGLSTSPR